MINLMLIAQSTTLMIIRDLVLDTEYKVKDGKKLKIFQTSLTLMIYKGGEGMDINEKLIQEITRIVVEQLKQSNQPIKPNKVAMIDGYAEVGVAVKGRDPKEVVIGVGPCFGKFVRNTITGISHKDVLKQLLAGIEEEGMKPRI